jgi:signal transduction histidine kinase
LLYPLAIFAIIAPTVILGLFGAYALRENELREDQYRDDLRVIQAQLESAVEARTGELAIDPPANPEDMARVTGEVERYFADYLHALASNCVIGLDQRVMATRSLESAQEFRAPPSLLEAIGDLGIRSTAREVVRESIALPPDAKGQGHTWIVIYQPSSKGFIAWHLNPGQIDALVTELMGSIELREDTLSLAQAGRDAFDHNAQKTQGQQTLGLIPVHQKLLPDRFVAMKLDAGNPLLNKDRLLGTMYVIIAVLCVPIVASATLMVVHMILREASEARKKVDFVSNVTHELKTPLTSIRMFVETLKLGRVKDEGQVAACLDVIMTETDRLGALIDHVLSFSKVENQVKKYNMQPNNIAQVVRDTIGLFKAQMANVQGEVRLKMLPGLPSQAVFDKDAIREVLLNLLSNSIKYSGAEKFVTVQVGIDHNDMFIEVTDRGIGIPQEDLARIFEKFYRVDQELSRNVDGTGLGLAICKEIVSAHGGRIAVSSVLRKGSSFTVFFPYRPPRVTGRPRTTNTLAVSSRRDTRTVAGEPV